jgi:bifunctional UDP-N-acetylglucosamine pyrophosphorylase/glucosamine-1-phosphate N-acetyltransferase
MNLKKPKFENYFEQTLNAFNDKDMFLKTIVKNVNKETEKKITVIGDRKVYIDNNVIFIGRNSDIEGPCYIGPNCIIGPNTFIRSGTYLEGKNRIGNSSEIKNSIILEGTNAPHFNYVGDSIIGRNCNLGAGTNIANLRHDNKNIKYGGKDSGRRKFGTVLGDNVKTGINVSINCGVRIASDKWIPPSEYIKKDIL